MIGIYLSQSLQALSTPKPFVFTTIQLSGQCYTLREENRWTDTSTPNTQNTFARYNDYLDILKDLWLAFQENQLFLQFLQISFHFLLH